MRLSRSAKVGVMLFLSSTMFFVELIVGIVAGSITLVADSFHMLNDVLGMAIALWAILMAKSTKTVPNNTYGWQRAEILGALTNGVLLLGLCLTIYIDAIERFIKIEEVRKPKLVMLVGCVGLVFNLLGLVLFHEHSHHGHSHSHSHPHGHDDEAVADEQEGLIAGGGSGSGGYATIDMDNQSIIGVPHPVYTHQAIIKSAQQMQDVRGAMPAPPRRKAGHAKKHNAGHLNMRGVWLHVFGDCITNVAVIISGLVIWKAEGSWRFYFDPAISLLINTLVVGITLPLVKSASFILLNGVPSSVDLDELRHELRAIPHVLNVHDLHVWQLSDTKNVASVHVLIDRPPFHECIHNSASASSLQSQAQAHAEPRLVTRNRQPLGSPSVDMDCLYMDVAAAVKRIMHAHGVHSTTIQPEFVVGQAVSVATTADASVSNVAIAADLAHEDSQATIGPCLLMCRSQGGGCQPSACCPDESPIKVVSQTP
ncbi:Zinc resistance conferring protein [Coemansia erecta]|nr:Zinc resistance conferring protein [Coemansia sp. RSA 2618]KAJ2830394.1 Zinc resistance conferring protein [Coemansia erecta]